MNNLSKNLKFLRKHRQLTQMDMPALIRVSRVTWSNWENGITEPGVEQLISISRLFKINIDHLLKTDISKNLHLVISGPLKTKGKKGNPPNELAEPEPPYTKSKKGQVEWLILKGISSLDDNMEMIKKKLGI